MTPFHRTQENVLSKTNRIKPRRDEETKKIRTVEDRGSRIDDRTISAIFDPRPSLCRSELRSGHPPQKSWEAADLRIAGAEHNHSLPGRLLNFTDFDRRELNDAIVRACKTDDQDIAFAQVRGGFLKVLESANRLAIGFEDDVSGREAGVGGGA